MKIELTRFRVLPGAEDHAAEWMEFLRTNPRAFAETLEPEQMYVETIFREVSDGVTYLYWYSVQGEDAQPVEESEHWLDQKHIEFWDRCIDPTYPPVDMSMEVTAIPERVLAAMLPLSGSRNRNKCP